MSFFAEPCWLRSLFPHGSRQPLAGQAYAADTADIAAAGIDTAASGWGPGVAAGGGGADEGIRSKAVVVLPSEAVVDPLTCQVWN